MSKVVGSSKVITKNGPTLISNLKTNTDIEFWNGTNWFVGQVNKYSGKKTNLIDVGVKRKLTRVVCSDDSLFPDTQSRKKTINNIKTLTYGTFPIYDGKDGIIDPYVQGKQHSDWFCQSPSDKTRFFFPVMQKEPEIIEFFKNRSEEDYSRSHFYYKNVKLHAYTITDPRLLNIDEFPIYASLKSKVEFISGFYNTGSIFIDMHRYGEKGCLAIYSYSIEIVHGMIRLFESMGITSTYYYYTNMNWLSNIQYDSENHSIKRNMKSNVCAIFLPRESVEKLSNMGVDVKDRRFKYAIKTMKDAGDIRFLVSYKNHLTRKVDSLYTIVSKESKICMFNSIPLFL